MSERGDPPPQDQRTRRRLARTGIPRATVRRDIVDQKVPVSLPASASCAHRLQTHDATEVRTEATDASAADAVVSSLCAEADKRPRPSTFNLSDQVRKTYPATPKKVIPCTEESGSAYRAIAAYVAAPMYGAELAKRTRPDTSYSCSEDQEDKRLKVSHAFTLPAPPEFAALPRSPSPARLQTPPPCLDSWPKNSTSYAELPSPTSRNTPMEVSRSLSPQPSTSYAAAAAVPRRSTPLAASSAPRHSRLSADPIAVTDPPRTTPQSAYPPLIVECLPNWTRHFETLRKALGHAPHARPLGRGMRFLPKSAEEYRAVQRYLIQAANQDSTISWYCYSPVTEIPLKVAIRGLPLETPGEEVVSALRALGFPAEAARAIPPPHGKHGCTYFVRLAHMTKEELRDLYAITELLYMPNVTVEAWRGGSRPPQCHRCQGFAHSSVNCHRAIRCVRCAEAHPVRDCPRPRDDVPTCVNCGKDHAANDYRCAFYKKEARRRGITLRPPPPRAHNIPSRNGPQQREPTASMRTHAPPTTRHDALRSAPPAAAAPSAYAVPQDTAVPQTFTAPQTSAAPSAGAAPPILVTTSPSHGVHLRTYDDRPNAAGGLTTLTAAANPPTKRGQPLRRYKKKRNLAPPSRCAEAAAASTSQPRQLKSERAAAPHPPMQEAAQATQVPASTSITASTYIATAPTAAGLSEQEPTQRIAPMSTQIPVQQPARQTIPHIVHQSTQVQPASFPTAQGEVQNQPDIVTIIRVVVEALMAGLTTYLQGRGAIPAISAAMAVLTRLHSC